LPRKAARCFRTLHCPAARGCDAPNLVKLTCSSPIWKSRRLSRVAHRFFASVRHRPARVTLVEVFETIRRIHDRDRAIAAVDPCHGRGLGLPVMLASVVAIHIRQYRDQPTGIGGDRLPTSWWPAPRRNRVDRHSSCHAVGSRGSAASPQDERQRAAANPRQCRAIIAPCQGCPDCDAAGQRSPTISRRRPPHPDVRNRAHSIAG